MKKILPMLARPRGTLHRADSNVAANVLHARDQNVSGVEQAPCPENVSNYLPWFSFLHLSKFKIKLTPPLEPVTKPSRRLKGRVLNTSASMGRNPFAA
jgi:hypothetical protein